MFENKNNISLRPDFMILIYPVISFTDSIGHAGSGNNLLGKTPEEKKIRFFSNEYHVGTSTPPAFIEQTGDDIIVSLDNSLVFYNSLNVNSIPAELYVYSSGGPGYLKQPPFEEWFGRCCY